MSRHLPAEWAPQSGVMVTWPHDGTDWAPILDLVEPVYDAIAGAVTAREQLLVVARDDGHAAHIGARLDRAGCDPERVTIARAPSDDSWTRDHGPLTVIDGGRPHLLDFRFNGWGGKHAHALDNRITSRLHGDGLFGETPLETVDLVLEGGSIDSDGEGTLLTTRHCLLTPTRNPRLDEGETVAALTAAFGADRILWLSHGHLEGDDTDGHIDTLARFCPDGTIAHVVCEDRNDPHHAPLAAMAAELAALSTADGRPYRLVPLPLPTPIRDEEGRRLPATHANFLVINGAVLVPVYGDPTDAVALDRLAGFFPGREIVAIDCRPLIGQNGSLHCITMQLPAGIAIGLDR